MTPEVLPEEEAEPKEAEPIEPEVPEPKDPTPEPEAPARKKRGPPKEPKEQCSLCLRYYCARRVLPGGHVCHPPIPKKAPTPPEPTPRPPTPEPEEPEDLMASSFVEPRVTHSDVVRFMARERMNRHERKRDRWQQQMFG